jgi:RNA methyltransferase, TrmH family
VVRAPGPLEVVAALRTAGYTVLAADGYGPVALPDAPLRPPIAWLFGSEAHGLPPEIAGAADARVRVPIYGRAESLNLAAAAAVCLYASAKSPST